MIGINNMVFSSLALARAADLSWEVIMLFHGWFLNSAAPLRVFTAIKALHLETSISYKIMIYSLVIDNHDLKLFKLLVQRVPGKRNGTSKLILMLAPR